MGAIQHKLIRRAREVYHAIMPCGSKGSLEDCFTITGDMVCFWFNTPDQSTHMIVEKVIRRQQHD